MTDSEETRDTHRTLCRGPEDCRHPEWHRLADRLPDIRRDQLLNPDVEEERPGGHWSGKLPG